MYSDTVLKIKQSRVKLLLDQPFFGTIILNLELVNATNSKWCPTAAVDGRRIYYNENFFKDLSADEVIFVLCHEVLHVALDHLGRRMDRDPLLWNMATDYVINALLHDAKIGKMPTKPVPVTINEDTKATGVAAERVGLYDSKYSGWTAEKVYEDLLKKKTIRRLTLDVHIELESGTGDSLSDSDGIDGKNDSQPVLSRETIDELRETLKDIVQQAATVAAGRMPGNIEEIFNELSKPKINWKNLIRESFYNTIRTEYSWNRPNKRYMYGGIFLPTIVTDTEIEVEVAIDASGSVSNSMLSQFFSEVYNITKTFSNFKLGVLTFDTKIYNHQYFTKNNANELLEYQCVGRGGTDFMCVWDYYKKQKIKPKLVIFLTDGYPGGSWGPATYTSTVWIICDIYNSKSKIIPPFGRYAHMGLDSDNVSIGSV